jgi:hypothetical protein
MCQADIDQMLSVSQCSVGQNSRQTPSQLSFFLSLVFATRSRIENISGHLKVIHLKPLQDVNEPLLRQFETHRDFSTLVCLTFLSDFSHKRDKNVLIMAEISQLFSTLVCLKVNLTRQF